MKGISSFKIFQHYPVMLNQVLSICSPEKGGLFIDCTFGSGGYSDAILSFPKTKVIAIDRDIETNKYVTKIKKKYRDRFKFYNLKFSELNKVVSENTKVDNIIFDLGLSSIQIKNLERGFSFKSKSKPDMRMGLNSISGLEVLNNFDLKTLNDILKLFGEEKDSFRIAKNIIQRREKKPITNVVELVDIIERSKKRDFKKKINISTKTFQAIRIFVNKEISELVEGLIKATKILKSGGKIIIISFHSIEDKIVKFFFTNFSENKSRGSRYYPDLNQKKIFFKNYKNKILRPSREEIEVNSPSRSAKLRYAIRNKDKFISPDEVKDKFAKYLELESRNV